jgi:hypothetical protein
MAQNHNLELALSAVAGKQAKETAEEPVQQRGQQDAQSEPLRPSSPAPRTGRIEFLYPTGTNLRNNSSTVTILQVGETRMLFPADAGVPALERAWSYLASSGGDTSPPNFVQIPHHGSRHNGSSDVFDLILGPVDQPLTKKGVRERCTRSRQAPQPRDRKRVHPPRLQGERDARDGNLSP